MDQTSVTTQKREVARGERTPTYICGPELKYPLSRRDPAEAALELRGDYEDDAFNSSRQALKE